MAPLDYTSFKTIQNKTYTSDLRELGSKFYAVMSAVEDQTSFITFLNEVKLLYPDATHHCYAWRMLGTEITEFSQDDGEPSGTAGLPILNQLRSFELINTAIIVVRYFGGTKLGKAGLIEAYGNAAHDLIQTATLINVQQAVSLSIQLTYETKRHVDGILKKHQISINNGEYLEKVVYHVHIPEQQLSDVEQDLKQIEYLGISYQVTGKKLIEV